MMAARRILRVKFALGLFEHPYATVAPAYEPTAANRAQARAVAAETIVLLKNDPVEGVGALLPFSKSAKTVALIGPLADAPQDMIGSWGAQGDAKFAITLKQALSERLGDHLLWYSLGCGVLSGEDLRRSCSKVNPRRTTFAVPDCRGRRDGQKGRCGRSGSGRRCRMDDRRSV